MGDAGPQPPGRAPSVESFVDAGFPGGRSGNHRALPAKRLLRRRGDPPTSAVGEDSASAERPGAAKGAWLAALDDFRTGPPGTRRRRKIRPTVHAPAAGDLHRPYLLSSDSG